MDKQKFYKIAGVSAIGILLIVYFSIVLLLGNIKKIVEIEQEIEKEEVVLFDKITVAKEVISDIIEDKEFKEELKFNVESLPDSLPGIQDITEEDVDLNDGKGFPIGKSGDEEKEPKKETKEFTFEERDETIAILNYELKLMGGFTGENVGSIDNFLPTLIKEIEKKPFFKKKVKLKDKEYIKEQYLEKRNYLFDKLKK